MKTNHGLFLGALGLALTAIFALAGCNDLTLPKVENGIPAAPTGVTAETQSASNISISWDSVSGASSYSVYRAGSSNGSYLYIYSTSNTFYTDTGLLPDTAYYYKVTARNDYGESVLSSYDYATTSGPDAPLVPAGITAEAESSSSISISWDSVSDADSYRVYRATSNGGTYSNITSTSGTSHTDTGLSPGTAYYYRVSALNANGVESTQSSYASATTFSSEPDTPAEEAAAFKTAYSAILVRTVEDIAIADEVAVNNALNAYNALSQAAQGLLTADKTLLDNLKTKIEQLKAADAPAAAAAFKSAHSAILARTAGNIGLADEYAVAAALAAYGSLNDEAKALLTAEQTLLNSLKVKIEQLKAAEAEAEAVAAATAFKSAHSAILARTAGNIAIADEYAVDAALAAYNNLDDKVKALLTAEQTLLNNLKTKIEELKAVQAAAAAFKTSYSAILAKTAGNIALADEDAVDAALAAYGSLDDEAKSLLGAEQTLLNNLKTRIEELKAVQDAVEAFKTSYGAILNKTAGNIVIADEDAVAAALAAYGSLGDEAKSLLGAEQTLLNNLKTRIEELKAVQAAAAAFKTSYSVILNKTVGNIALADEYAVAAALAAYGSLDDEVKALLTAEQTLLNSLKAKIDTLGQGSIILTYPTDAASGLLSNNHITIAKTAGTYQTTRSLTVIGDFDSYRWRVDGSARGSGNTFTLNAGDYAPGTHQISLEVILNGAVYSKSGSFTVEP